MKPRIYPFSSRYSLSRPLVLIVGLSLSLVAQAASFQWDSDGDSSAAFGGSGTWNTSSSRWHTGDEYGTIGAWSNAPTDSIAVFGGSSGTITTGADISVNQLKFNMTGYTLSGGDSITLNGTTPTIATANGVATTIGNNTNIILAGSAGLVKQGPGTLTLNGNASNTFTGGLTLKSGTLALDFTNFTTPTNQINSGNALSLAGGKMTVLGKNSGTTSQSFNGTTLSVGGGSILVNPNGGTSTTLALGALNTSAVGGSLLVGSAASPGSGTVAFTTTTNATNSIYGGRVVYSTDGGTTVDWATTASGSSPYTLSGLSSYSSLPVSGGSSSTNYRVTGGVTLTGSVNANTLKMENASADLSINSRLLTLNSGGLLITGSTPRSITGTTGATRLTAGSGSNYDLVIQNYSTGNQTISAVIGNNGSNAVSLTLAGPVSNTLTLSGINTYSGATYINGGRLQITAANQMGNTSAVYVANGGQFYFGSGFTYSKSTEISGFGRFDGGVGGNYTQFGAIRISTNSDVSGAITLAGDSRIGKHNGGTGTISGQITGGYALDFLGSSAANNTITTIVVSNTSNDYTGDTSITHVDYNVTTPFTGGSAVLQLGNSNVLPDGAGKGNLVFYGTDAQHQTILELNGKNETVNGLKNLTASGAMIRNNHASTASTLTIGAGDTTSSYSGTIVNGGAATLSLAKTGSGKLTLSNTQTYTGTTNVSGGTLEIATGGSLASGSAVTVTGSGSALIVNGSIGGSLLMNANTTLSGAGSVNGAATIQGAHSPGNSPGVQTFASNLTYSGGASEVNWELSADTVTQGNPTRLFDQVVVNGNLDFAGTTDLNLLFNSAGSNVSWNSEFWASDRTWTLFDVAGTTFNFVNLQLNGSDWLDGSGASFAASRPQASFALLQSGQDILLSYTVPETSTAWLVGLGLMATWRRRRQSRGD